MPNKVPTCPGYVFWEVESELSNLKLYAPRKTLQEAWEEIDAKRAGGRKDEYTNG